MKAVMIDAIESVAIKDFHIPELKAYDVLIKVKIAGICGSDIHTYKGLHSFRKPPVVIGHEVSGEIVKTGKNATRFVVGDKVTMIPQIGCGSCEHCQNEKENYCNLRRAPGIGDWLGTIAEYCVIPESALFKLPTHMSHEIGVLTEPLAVAFHAVKKAEIKPDDRIAIIGAGPIGLLSLVAAIEKRATQILLTDIFDYPLEAAKDLGAADTVNVSKSFNWIDEAIERMNGQFDKVLITAGVNDIVNDSLKLIKKGGKIITVAMFHEEQKIDIANLQGTEKEIIGCMTYNRTDFYEAINSLDRLSNPVERIVSHVVPYLEAESAFKMVEKKQDGSLKVLLKF